MSVLYVRNEDTGEFEPIATISGADGHTPEKYVDYWTEEDKADVVNEVLNALPTWNGGEY
jgi:hypothetical protein